jgi:hypothetical protein
MSVEFVYIPHTRVGNVLFQYACARLFAESQGLKFLTPWSPPNGKDVVRIVGPDGAGEAVDGPLVRITDDQWVVGRHPGVPFRILGPDEDLLTGAWPRARYVLEGFFQRSAWYLSRRAEIERFMIPEPKKDLNTRDIVVNLRIGADFRRINWTIHPQWYLDILARERFERLHIVADEKDERYLAHFAAYDPIVVSSGPKGDWEHLRSFDRIVSSNSSFAWWACFFSKASRIYTFKRWNSNPMVHVGPFPENGIEIDGPFLHEAPF